MIRKQTILLWIAAAVLGGIIFVFDSPWKSSDTLSSIQQTLLPSSQIGAWESLVIKKEQSEFVFQKEGSIWQIIQPVSDRAHPTLVSGLIESLSQLVPKTTLSSDVVEREGGWSTFGLEPGNLTITLGKGGESVSIYLGNRESVGNQVYLRVDDESVARVVDAGWMDALPDEVSAWRDPRIVSGDLQQVDYVEIMQADGKIAVARNTAGGWQLMVPEALKETRANIPRIETLLQKALPAWRAQTFLSQEETDTLDLLGLENPVLNLMLKSGNKTVAQVAFGFNVPDQPGLRYARAEGRSQIMLVSDLLFKQQLDIPATAFRSPFLIDPSFTANRIKIKATEAFTLDYEPTSTHWKITEPKAIPSDKQLVAQFRQTLADIQVKAFHDAVPTEQEASIFSNGLYEIYFSTISDQTETAPLNIQFSRSFAGTMYAKRSDEQTIYELPASLLNEFPKGAFELRDLRLWNVPVRDITRIDIRQGGLEQRLDQSVNGVWMVDRDVLDDAQKVYMKGFLESASQLTVVKWIATGDERYAQFGLDADGDGLQLILHFQHGGENLSKRLLFGRQSARSDIYAGVTLETGPIICEVPSAFVQAVRYIHSWKKENEPN